jgi:hypothetical protein
MVLRMDIYRIPNIMNSKELHAKENMHTKPMLTKQG